MIWLDQRGVDVAIMTYGPDGSVLNEYDSRNGELGLERVCLEATSKGRYDIEVRDIDEAAPGGKCDLHVVVSGLAPNTPEAVMDVSLARNNTNDSPGPAIPMLRDGSPGYSKAFGMAIMQKMGRRSAFKFCGAERRKAPHRSAFPEYAVGLRLQRPPCSPAPVRSPRTAP